MLRWAAKELRPAAQETSILRLAGWLGIESQFTN